VLQGSASPLPNTLYVSGAWSSSFDIAQSCGYPQWLIVSASEGILAPVSRGERTLDTLQGTLQLLVLRALRWGPRHGYAVARFIRHGSGGELRILDGVLYTSLHRLAERGFVDSEWATSEEEKRARFYELTAVGRGALRTETETWQRSVAAIASVLQTMTETA
jgi:PadR family transcriptional regulator, regulatory protein PadR